MAMPVVREETTGRERNWGNRNVKDYVVPDSESAGSQKRHQAGFSWHPDIFSILWI